MKHKIERVEEEEGRSFEVSDITIKTASKGKVETDNLGLTIGNWPDQGCLIMCFGKGSGTLFKITIADGLMSFERHVSRPNHDHDSTETLLRNSKGSLFWSADHPNEREKEEVAKIPFGSIIDTGP